jgi:hypothetical protein
MSRSNKNHSILQSKAWFLMLEVYMEMEESVYALERATLLLGSGYAILKAWFLMLEAWRGLFIAITPI